MLLYYKKYKNTLTYIFLKYYNIDALKYFHLRTFINIFIYD